MGLALRGRHAGQMPALERRAHEREKLLGSATLPKSFRHLPCVYRLSIIPYINSLTRFRIRPRGKDYAVCVRTIS